GRHGPTVAADPDPAPGPGEPFGEHSSGHDRLPSGGQPSASIALAVASCSLVSSSLAPALPPSTDWVKVSIAGVPSTVVTPRNRASPPGAAQVCEIGCHSSIALTAFLSLRKPSVSLIDFSGGSPIPVFSVHSGAMFL